MSVSVACPKARPGLLLAEHEKAGRLLFSVLSRTEERVVLLEPWEHAVLVLCNGHRSVESIAEVVAGQIREVNVSEVATCVRMLGHEGLLLGPGGAAEPSEHPGPRALAAIQQAYQECHNDPLRTGRILAGESLRSYPEVARSAPVGLRPTVTLGTSSEGLGVGSTLVVEPIGPARSLLREGHGLGRSESDDHEERHHLELFPFAEEGTVEEEPIDVAELLRAVDSDLSAFEDSDLTRAPERARPRVMSGEATLPASTYRPALGEKVLTNPPQLALTRVAPPPSANVAGGTYCPRCGALRTPNLGRCERCGLEDPC